MPTGNTQCTEASGLAGSQLYVAAVLCAASLKGRRPDDGLSSRDHLSLMGFSLPAVKNTEREAFSVE